MIYNDKRWETKRQTILRRDEYLCRECGRYGKRVDAKHVHHIIPLDERPDLKLESDNLISLCRECHNAMHDRVTQLLTETGKALRRRMNVDKL